MRSQQCSILLGRWRRSPAMALVLGSRADDIGADAERLRQLCEKTGAAIGSAALDLGKIHGTRSRRLGELCLGQAAILAHDLHAILLAEPLHETVGERLFLSRFDALQDP